jgi:hypothetical protein
MITSMPLENIVDEAYFFSSTLKRSAMPKRFVRSPLRITASHLFLRWQRDAALGQVLFEFP